MFSHLANNALLNKKREGEGRGKRGQEVRVS